MYSASLCFHVNNIYNKLAELQWQLPHPNLHMNTGNAIQIEAPDFNPDINKALPTSTDQHTNDPVTQGSETHIPKSAEKLIESRTPASPHQNIDIQELDWPDTIPVEIPPQHDQQIEQIILTLLTHRNLGLAKIPQLKDNSEGEKYQDLETYLATTICLKQVSASAETTDQDYLHWMMTNIIKK